MNRDTTATNFVEIKDNTLVFNFNTLGESERFTVRLHKTLRLPDDNKKYNLPPSLGDFDLEHVQDYKGMLPESWSGRGGVFFPMYQSEAMWLSFTCDNGRPYAVKIAAGKINAVDGKPWKNELTKHGTNLNSSRSREAAQDYMVCPDQPWLDGFNVGKGVIRQFIASVLGSGYSAEEQLTGEANWGGIQIIVYPMKDSEWEKLKPPVMYYEDAQASLHGGEEHYMAAASSAPTLSKGIMRSSAARSLSADAEMGLAAGGMMKQEVYEDLYGLNVWDTENALRTYVHILNSNDYESVTGKKPHRAPLGPSDYKRYNYAWFDYYSTNPSVSGENTPLAKLDSVASLQQKKGQVIIEDNSSLVQPKPINLKAKKIVKDSPKW